MKQVTIPDDFQKKIQDFLEKIDQVKVKSFPPQSESYLRKQLEHYLRQVFK